MKFSHRCCWWLSYFRSEKLSLGDVSKNFSVFILMVTQTPKINGLPFFETSTTALEHLVYNYFLNLLNHFWVVTSLLCEKYDNQNEQKFSSIHNLTFITLLLLLLLLSSLYYYFVIKIRLCIDGTFYSFWLLCHTLFTFKGWNSQTSFISKKV